MIYWYIISVNGSQSIKHAGSISHIKTFIHPGSICKHIDGSSQVLTGSDSSVGCPVISSASDALVLTGGGLGGCRWVVVAKADAAGEVKLTSSDWPISNWEKNRIRPEHYQQSYTLTKEGTGSLQGS